MTRFLYEDSQLPDTPLSNTALQRDAKARTHAVIQRSRPRATCWRSASPRRSVSPSTQGSPA
jgi:pyoverdine/dityrosine biosynthesis protein Dit1